MCERDGSGCFAVVDGGAPSGTSCAFTIAVEAHRLGHTHLAIVDARGDEIDSWEVGTW